MTQPDEKLKKFSEAIFKDAEAKRQEILNEIEEYRTAVIEKAEEDILTEAYHYIQNEMTDIKNQYSKLVSVKSMESRRELIKKRDAYTEQIFEEVKKRLIEFTKSPEYEAFLIKAAQVAKDVDGAIITLRKDDLIYTDKIAGALGKQISTAENKSIGIGGIIIKSEKTGIIIDETLDERLKNQHAWFATNSNLTIS